MGAENNTNLDCVTEHQLPVSTGSDSLDFQILLVQINRHPLATGQYDDALLSKIGGGDTQDQRPLSR